MKSCVKINFTELIIVFGMSLFSVASSLIILFDYAEAMECGLELLFLLPIAFLIGLFIILFTGTFRTVEKSVVGIIVLGTYFVRMVLTPMTMPLAGYASVMPFHTSSSSSSIAIIMMVLETIVVLPFMSFQIFRKTPIGDSELGEISEMLQSKEHKPSVLIWLFVIAMVAVMVMILRIDESIFKSEFLFLLDTNKQYFTLSNTKSGIGTLSMWVEILEVFFRLVQVLLPPLLIWYIAKMKAPIGWKFLLSFLIFLIVSVIGTENRIDALFAGAALIMSMRRLYGNKFNNISKIFILIVAIVAIVGLSIKSGLVKTTSETSQFRFSELSVMLSAYFSGVHTTAIGVELIEQSRAKFNILMLVPDALSKIPFFSYAANLFFNISYQNSNQLFNSFIAENVGHNYGQILPTTALGFEYFSVFYLVYPCFLIKLAIWFENQGKRQNDILRINLYYWITICVAGASVVASGLLIWAKLFWFLLIYLILKIFDAKKKTN